MVTAGVSSKGLLSPPSMGRCLGTAAQKRTRLLRVSCGRPLPHAAPSTSQTCAFCPLQILHFLLLFFLILISLLSTANDKIVSSSQTTCKPRNELFLVGEFKLLSYLQIACEQLASIRKAEVWEGCEYRFGCTHRMASFLALASAGAAAPFPRPLCSTSPFGNRPPSSPRAPRLPRTCQGGAE